MIQIGIRDFQVIERLSLPLEGIVAITGPSNNGKTSVARALEACLYNWTGEHFINDQGAEECMIGLKFSESKYRPSVDVLWKKPRTGGAQYILNGVQYDKAGRSALPELMAEGFAVLETPRAKFPLQFWKQMEIFLVNESPSTVFDVLSRLLEDRKLLPVLKSLKEMISQGQKDAQRQEGQFQLLTETQTALEAQHSRYRAFSDFEPRILRVRSVRSSLQKLLDLGSERQKLEQSLESKQREIRNIGVPFEIAVRCSETAGQRIALLTDVERMRTMKTTITEIQKQRRSLQTAASALDRIQVLDPQRILTFEDRSARLLKARSMLQTVTETESRYEQATEISDRLAAFETRIDRINALSDTIARLEDLRSRFETLEALRAEAEREDAETEETFQEFKLEAGVCPECGGLGFIGGDHEHD